MGKTQSLLAALVGWFVGSFTMWRLGFDTLTSLVGGLLVGAPVAYIAYDPKAFGISLKQQSVLAMAKLRSFPRVDIPSSWRALQLVQNTLLAGLVACSWMFQAVVLVSWTLAYLPDDTAGESFFAKIFTIVFLSCLTTFMTYEASRDYNAPWGRWVHDSEGRKAMFGWLAVLVGPLNNLLILAIFVLAIVALAATVARAVVITVCCSGRLIALASAVIGLVVEWQTGSILAGLTALVLSWAVQWFAIHDWAVEKERGVVDIW